MPESKTKIRLDQLMVQRDLAPSRTRAQALIMAGRVVVGDNRVDKPGTKIAPDSAIRVKGKDHPYVSRGGVKLEHALKHFGIDVAGFVALDVGASTGGFTDCLLQRGAIRVFALDVGRAQLHQKLRDDRRVKVMERFNVRNLTPRDLDEKVDLAVFDLSFISLELALPPVLGCLKSTGKIISLVKPQFEVGKGKVGKGGIVRDEAQRLFTVEKIQRLAIQLGLDSQGYVRSPITGAQGNVEYLLYLSLPQQNEIKTQPGEEPLGTE